MNLFTNRNRLTDLEYELPVTRGEGKGYLGSLRLTCMCMHTCLPACQVASVLSSSVQPYGLEPTRLLCPWDSQGKNTGKFSYWRA